MSILRLVSRLGIAVTGILFGSAIQGCGGEITHVPAIEQAGAERIRGTRVSLVRPEGWDVAPSFAGFMEMETQSTLMVMEIEGPYDEVATGFNDKRVLAAQKMKIVDRVPFSHGTYPGLLFQMTQKNGPVPVRKWVWLFGSEVRSVMVMGVCAEELPENVFDALGTAVRSASWAPDLILDPKAELDYFLGDDGGMKPISLMSASLTYNLDGEIDEGGLEGKPVFLVAPALNPTPSTPEKYAPRRLRLTAGHKKVEAGELTPIQIDGLSGYECIGTGIHRKSDQESFIYQVMLFEGSSHWILTGIAREKDRDQYLPVFRRMARSFQRKFETIASADGRTSMEVPKTWTLRAGIDEDADIQAGQAIADTYVIVLSEAKADAAEGTTFDLYTQRCRDDFTADALSLGEVETIEINGLQGTKLPFRIGEEDTPLTFVHATLEGKDTYHQIVLWCSGSDEAHGLPGLHRALMSFREVQ